MFEVCRESFVSTGKKHLLSSVRYESTDWIPCNDGEMCHSGSFTSSSAVLQSSAGCVSFPGDFTALSMPGGYYGAKLLLLNRSE